MNRASLYFTAPGFVEIREESIPQPLPGQVLVKTLLSAISAGSELLVYRGLCPEDMPLDESIPSLQVRSTFPLKYGYSVVGIVTALGRGVSPEWEGRIVFSFHPHESHFIADTQELFSVPPDMPPEKAVFLPSLETAVNLAMDGQPVIGERVVIFGQGVVGLLTTALLARYPLAELLTVDRYPRRREASLMSGARASLNACDPNLAAATKTLLASGDAPKGADLAYEISGVPDALEQALSVTGFNGRIVIGSWFGMKPVSLNLGGRFHRNRIQMISSQVSTVNPIFTGRWTKLRRLSLVWSLLKETDPTHLITHSIPFSQVGKAYDWLDKYPEDCLQVVLTY